MIVRRLIFSIAVALTICGFSSPLSAQRQDVDELNREVERLYVAGRYPQAIELANRALALGEETFGPDHASVATALHNLAELYRAAGRSALAEPLMLRALAVREKVLGPDDTSVGLTLNNLAGLYLGQGRYKEAEEAFRRSIAVRTKAYPPDHPDIGQSYNNLAQLYQIQTRYAEAEDLYLLAIEIFVKARSRSLGAALNNLAQLYQVQGRYVEAEPLFKGALTISRKVGGAEHQSVGVSLCTLASLYTDQGRYEESEALHERGLAILKRTLGPEHPMVGTVLNNLAQLYRAQGRDADAEPVILRSLAIREKKLRPGHADVGQSLNNLASLYQVQGRNAEAESRFKRAISIFEKSLGPESPDLGKSLNNLAELYRAQRRYAEAEPLYERAIAIFEKTFGSDQQNVGVLLNNLAGLYWAQGRYADAEPLYQRTIAIFERAQGPDHPYVGEALSHLADFYQQLGSTSEEAALRERLAGMPPEGTRHLPLYFVTNRKRSGEGFGGALSETSALGRVVMRVPADEVKNRAERLGETLGQLETATTGDLTAADVLEVVRQSGFDSADAFAAAARAGQRRSSIFKGQALVFVHGYNNTFQVALRRATQVSFDLQFDGILIPFAWPSQGGVTDYFTDNDMAMKSVDALVSFLDDLSRTMPKVRVHLLAHSMGNQVMLRALCKIAKRSEDGSARRHNFGQVISAHADVSYADFEKLTTCFKNRVENITLYVNERDTALSARCTGFRCRAGNWARGYTSVDVVDTTTMSKGFWRSLARGFDHDVFVRNPLLFGDITRLLLTGQRPVDARTPEFRPKKDAKGKVYWAYDKSFDPAAQAATVSQN
jgi:esterase/lipase superfamily enzyme/Tfp pilus assembly protein PilF